MCICIKHACRREMFWKPVWCLQHRADWINFEKHLAQHKLMKCQTRAIALRLRKLNMRMMHDATEWTEKKGERASSEPFNIETNKTWSAFVRQGTSRHFYSCFQGDRLHIVCGLIEWNNGFTNDCFEMILFCDVGKSFGKVVQKYLCLLHSFQVKVSVQ